MPAKKSIRMKTVSRRAKTTRAKRSTQAAWWTSTPVLAGGVVSLFAVAMLVAVVPSSGVSSAARRGDVNLPHDAAAQPAPADTSASRTRPAEPQAHSTEAPAISTETSGDVRTAPVTLTGCLERDDDRFRLTETTGASAPTSRSWKSAFMKKRAASVDVVDQAKRLSLASHVGQRVSVTGTLVDREMRVASVQRLAASCAAPTKVKA